MAGSVGVLVGGVAAFLVPWQAAVLAGWDVASLVLIAWVGLATHRLDAARTAALATREDDSRAATRLTLVAAAVVSLFGVAAALVKAGQVRGGVEIALTVQSVVTVLSGWVLVHLVFMLRYAHLYYEGTPGGIVFHGDDPPDYGDFAYLSFTIGMTYQVSDNDLTSRRIRRVLLRHALLSYFFGTIIVALTINVLAGFVR